MNSVHTMSIHAAEQFGFHLEGFFRWSCVLGAGKEQGGKVWKGIRGGGDTKQDCRGLDSVMLAICWDDWEGGVRKKVRELMRR